MKLWVGVTDDDWFKYLPARQPAEVNFWQPSGGRQFRSLDPGEPFLFKLHESGVGKRRETALGRIERKKGAVHRRSVSTLFCGDDPHPTGWERDLSALVRDLRVALCSPCDRRVIDITPLKTHNH